MTIPASNLLPPGVNFNILEVAFTGPLTTAVTQTTYGRGTVQSLRLWINQANSCAALDMLFSATISRQISATVINGVTVPLISTWRLVAGSASFNTNVLALTQNCVSATATTITFATTVSVPSGSAVSWPGGTGLGTGGAPSTTLNYTLSTGVQPANGDPITFTDLLRNIVTVTPTQIILDRPVTLSNGEFLSQVVPNGPNQAAALALPTDNIGAIGGVLPDIYKGGSMTLAQWNSGFDQGALYGVTGNWSGGTALGTPFT